MITYVYSKRQRILFQLIKHVDKKAIAELIPKFLEGVPKDTNNDFDEIRIKLIYSLFESLEVNSDNEKINNIESVIVDISENKYLLDLILNNKSILTHLTNQLKLNSENYSSEQNYNYYEILLIFTNLIRLAISENLKTPSIKIENSNGEDLVNTNIDIYNIDNTPLGEVILENLSLILDNFIISEKDKTLEIESTFGANYKPLGLKK